MKHNPYNILIALLMISAIGCSPNLPVLQDAGSNFSSTLPEEDETPPGETPPETGSDDEETPPVTETPAREVVPLWEAAATDGKEWSVHVDRELDRLGSSLLDVIPADASLFCPKYKNLSYAQRKQYWAFLISSMVRFESNFKTSASYTEDFNDSNGKRVISRGLLQISIESGNAYGCGFRSAQDLHNPYQNLSCGIRILDRWLGRDGRIAGKVNNAWRGGARYWSVLRAGDKTSYKSIVSWSQNLAFCK